MSASSYIATHGLDPIPMSALTPSAKGSAETALGTTENANPQQAATDDEGFTFWDVLDIINPLQHIPGVSTIYREVTGDKIGDVARIAGATLFGGPIGLALAGADYALKEATGGHLDEHAVAMINGTTIDGSPIEDQGNSQLASAGSYFSDDTGEAGSNMLAYAHPTAWTANTTSGDAAPVSQVASSAAGATPATAPATVAVAAPSSSVAETEMVVAAANNPTTNTALPQNAGRAFALDRKRDVRSDALPVNPPRADAFAAINGSARSIHSSASATSATPSMANPAAPSAPETAMPLPLGMASQTATPAVANAEPTGVSAQPNQQAMARALQAQGLQPTSGSLPLGLFDQAPVQAPKVAPNVAPATAATSSPDTTSRRQPQQQAELPAQAEPQTQASGPVQIPAWFDQAMQKAVANYERTGSLTGTPAAMPVQPKGTSS